MYEVIGETVKSAISIKLGQIFGADTNRYKESVTNMRYPNFFIYIVSTSTRPDTKNRWIIDYLINIRYRYVQDIETVSNLEQILDGIGFRLSTELDTIELQRPVKVTNIRYEKADGVLQFFCNIPIRMMKELTPEQKMEILNLNEKLKEEDENGWRNIL